MGENELGRRAGVWRSFKTGKEFELNFKAMGSDGGFLLDNIIIGFKCQGLVLISKEE